VSGTRGLLPAVDNRHSHLLSCQGVWLLERSLGIGHCGETMNACPSLVLSLTLLLFHVGTNNIVRGSLDNIKCVYIAMEPVVKGTGGPSAGFLLDPASKGAVLQEEWMHAASHQLVGLANVKNSDLTIMTIEHPLRIKVCQEKVGSI